MPPAGLEQKPEAGLATMDTFGTIVEMSHNRRVLQNSAAYEDKGYLF